MISETLRDTPFGGTSALRWVHFRTELGLDSYSLPGARVRTRPAQNAEIILPSGANFPGSFRLRRWEGAQTGALGSGKGWGDICATWWCDEFPQVLLLLDAVDINPRQRPRLNGTIAIAGGRRREGAELKFFDARESLDVRNAFQLPPVQYARLQRDFGAYENAVRQAVSYAVAAILGRGYAWDEDEESEGIITRGCQLILNWWGMAEPGHDWRPLLGAFSQSSLDLSPYRQSLYALTSTSGLERLSSHVETVMNEAARLGAHTREGMGAGTFHHMFGRSVEYEREAIRASARLENDRRLAQRLASKAT